MAYKELLRSGARISPRDLNRVNFLITKGDHILLANFSDLGLSKGYINYCARHAPEIFTQGFGNKKDVEFNEETAVWSLGIIALELLYLKKQVPFE